MKILLLTKKPPYPSKDGEAVAIANIIDGLLAQGHDISLLYMNTIKFSTDESVCKTKGINASAVFVNTNISLLGAFKNLFSNQSYNIERFISSDYAKQLEEILIAEKFDIIQLETLYLMPYIKTIRQFSKAKIVLRTHNIESQIWERLAENEKIGIKKWYLRLLAKRLRKYEESIINQYDALVPITNNDLKWYQQKGNNKPVYVLPIAVNPKAYKVHKLNKEKMTCYFLGSLDWQPNLEGLQWYLNNVQALSDVELYIAGRNKTTFLKESDNVYIVGEVDSAIDFMNKHPIMIVPLFAGSGMRVKIIEAMALGKIVISTSIGAEGIEYIDGENLLIANDGKAFIAKINQVMADKKLFETISKNARKLIEEKYNSTQSINKLLAFYKSI